MAKKKTVQATEEVAEEMVENAVEVEATPENITEEVVEETPVEAEAEEVPTEVSEAEEGEVEAPPSEDTLTEEQINAMTEEFAAPQDKLNEIAKTITTDPESAKDAISAEIERVDKCAKELEKDIKKREQKVSNSSKEQLKKMFGYGFGNFWNGQSDGWNN